MDDLIFLGLQVLQLLLQLSLVIIGYIRERQRFKERLWDEKRPSKP